MYSVSATKDANIRNDPTDTEEDGSASIIEQETD